MKRQITCIVCPRGCQITVEDTQEGLKVTGNSCSRGKEHAIAECTHPVRTLTSSVRVSNRADTMVSVKSEAPVPKEKMMEIMEMIRRTQTQAPVKMGEVLLDNVYGTRIIATREIL